MGRFESAAEFYQYREPYPPRFFQTVAATLEVSKQTRLLDVGCGPGNLVIGFAPFAGFSKAIDVEPEMLRIGGEAARKSHVAVDFDQVAIENLQAGEASFHLVTIGRALHWLDRESTLKVFERIVTTGGKIAVCSSTSVDAPWVEKFKQLRRDWSGDSDEARYRPDLDAWFASSRFKRHGDIKVTEPNAISIDHLVKRALSFSSISPAALGDRRTEFEAELRRSLQDFASNGFIDEEVTARAAIFS